MQEKPWGRKSREFKVHSLIDKVYKLLNLYIAWEKVKANKGAGGVDRVSVEEFKQNLDLNLREIQRLLYEDRYIPQPLKRVWIPKSNGEKRPLGIPTIRDRVVQQALLNRLTKIFEPKFLECSFGFRPNRSTHQAIEKVEGYLKDGCELIVEVDIEKCFDTIDHSILMDLIHEEIADGRVLRIIRSFVEAGVMEEIRFTNVLAGTPQGGVISPLLANIYLHPFDEAMMKEGFRVIRYADDIVVLCQTRQEAEAALSRIKGILEDKLKLRLNGDKTKIVHKSRGFEFLGFKFGCGYSDYKIPRDKAIIAFKDKVRFMSRRHQPKSMSTVISELNPVVRGWGNYFIKGNCKRIFTELDFWLRNRITAYKLKRQGGYEHRKYPYSRLRAMGMLFLKDLLYARQPALLPVMGQYLRRADCGKSARSVR
ncbi:MAG: group II intron reverse transcriptase/maturase [Deltaproteobacteria bacterium]